MELSQYQSGRLDAREDGGGRRRAEGALYLAAAWLRSKGGKGHALLWHRGTVFVFRPPSLPLFVF